MLYAIGILKGPKIINLEITSDEIPLEIHSGLFDLEILALYWEGGEKFIQHPVDVFYSFQTQ